MENKHVLVAHNNMDFIKQLADYFQQEELYTISEYALDGQELLNKVNLDDYDIVIVKNALTYTTGLYALASLLQKTKKSPEYIILITPFISNFILNKCKNLGVYCMHNLDIRVNKISNLLLDIEIKKSADNATYFDYQMEIIKLLRQIGLLKVYLGYTYFEYVLNIMFEIGDNIYKSMKEIYEVISIHFNSTPSSVEKAMRYCMKSSLGKHRNFYAKLLFGCQANDYPTTSIFLQVCIKTLKELKNTITTNNYNKSYRKI